MSPDQNHLKFTQHAACKLPTGKLCILLIFFKINGKILSGNTIQVQESNSLVPDLILVQTGFKGYQQTLVVDDISRQRVNLIIFI